MRSGYKLCQQHIGISISKILFLRCHEKAYFHDRKEIFLNFSPILLIIRKLNLLFFYFPLFLLSGKLGLPEGTLIDTWTIAAVY